ncbi:Hypothetical predicted protein [Paramuricea clavata]|uniref:Endonuclease/exonuclease/phosphatase domain-containing protein n=1 Tax=Paramuricea clavata TaxID=317549 RepID=A0A7D9HCE2_PARCT|nr:Hypothetical predicted protein [Paramuricea clavata]
MRLCDKEKREGKHTTTDLQKLKERCVQESNCPQEAPRLFIQNALVDKYNEQVYESFTDNRYTIKAQESVIGAASAELKEKIMRQIPYVPLRNSKQLAHKLKLAVGQRTEVATNVRTDDGLTNGANVGRKTRQENRTLYVRGVQSTWTPIKPVTTQFPVGRTKSAQVVRKQFPLRPASAKTVHRSQGDTQTQVVVNLNSNRSFPYIHYVALSRVTTIEGLYITDLCEDRKISVDQRVVKEMEILRTEQSLNLCFKPLYMLDQSDLKVCYLNARSLHKHIEDVRKDINYSSMDIVIFTETRFNSSDTDDIYNIDGYRLFRNDVSQGTGPGRPYGGTAVYSRVPLKEGYPYAHNVNGIEFTIIKTESNPHLNIIGVYRSPNIAISRLLSSLRSVLDEDSSAQNIIIGDFNVNWMVESDRQSLYNLMVVQNHYRQLITGFTTDNRTLIDHLYTNLFEEEIEAGILETYFSDHKAIWASLRT